MMMILLLAVPICCSTYNEITCHPATTSLIGRVSHLNYISRGGGIIPAGYNPFGYKITELGERYLALQGSLDSDLGRFLASLKTRKTSSAIKDQWLEIVRVNKAGQSMRIYRTLDELLKFCLEAGFIN